MMVKRTVKDENLLRAYPAMLRAAKDARRIAYATNTPLVIMEDGKIVYKWMTKEDIDNL